ncbi:MAG: competence/damage-inducible protein A [Candidatus Limnocylindrales bacterium]
MTTSPPFPTPGRVIRSAEIVAVGSELTTGETRDTNGVELAASLATAGVTVRRITALPDDLALVTARFREAFSLVDLVMATGGLGPTPDDLTREAVAAAVGEDPSVDAHLEDWLRDMFARRGTPLPDVNLKQAWLIPSATSIPNENGTAPGWWVDRPDGRVAVLLPGPPREMQPMWTDWVLPRLRARGLGDGRLVRTLRTYGIGESSVVERLGEEMLRRDNPIVATYARADWLDIRISAVDPVDETGRRIRSAADIIETTVEHIREALPGHVWAEGETTWAEVVTEASTIAQVRFATIEAGTRGQLGALLADVPNLERAAALGPKVPANRLVQRLSESAAEAAQTAQVDLGLALAAWPDGPHTQVRAAIACSDGTWSRELELRLFTHGAHGRLRAAVAAAAFLAETLRDRAGSPSATDGTNGTGLLATPTV